MYIVFEGIDGSGKTTQCQLLGRALDTRGYTPIYLQEPTYGELGRNIRDVIATESDLVPSELHKLFTEDRVAHVNEKILPVLRLIEIHPNFVLLQSRGYLSAPTYQADDLQDLAAILRGQQEIAPRPDMFIYIDVNERVAMQRIRNRDATRVTFDKEKKLKSIRERYLSLIDEPSERIVQFDGDQCEESLHQSILELVTTELQGEQNE
ncbi:MAG: dTMP kinase [Gammaproteobacteria bacterium]|nr:MAG: dTMP kinase [Gammaproteobacteria bacterium]